MKHSLLAITALISFLETLPLAAGEKAKSSPLACIREKRVCQVLALGDSITYGVGSETGGGYRLPLWQKLQKVYPKFTFVGPQSPRYTGPKGFSNASGGYRGEYIGGSSDQPGISEKSEKMIASFKPDIITVLIGANDILSNYELKSAPQRLQTLLTKLCNAGSDRLIIVGELLPALDDDYTRDVQSFNAALSQSVKALKGKSCPIEQAKLFDSIFKKKKYKSYFADYVHPNDQGYELMSSAWFEAVSKFIPPITGSLKSNPKH